MSETKSVSAKPVKEKNPYTHLSSRQRIRAVRLLLVLVLFLLLSFPTQIAQSQGSPDQVQAVRQAIQSAFGWDAQAIANNSIVSYPEPKDRGYSSSGELLTVDVYFNYDARTAPSRQQLDTWTCYDPSAIPMTEFKIAFTVGPNLPAAVKCASNADSDTVAGKFGWYPSGGADAGFVCGNLLAIVSSSKLSRTLIEAPIGNDPKVYAVNAQIIQESVTQVKQMAQTLANALIANNACGAPPAAPPDIDLTIDHIEVVQVVQDENNSVPLVAEKNTLLRIFVKVNGNPKGAVAGVTAEVLAFPPGVAKPIEIKPDNAPFAAPLIPDRNKLTDSLNFFFPKELTIGTYPLEINLNPTRAVTETNYDNNHLTTQLVFVHQNPFRIEFVRVGYDPSGQRNYRWPTGSLENYASFLSKIYPVADGGVQYIERRPRLTVNKPLADKGLGSTDPNVKAEARAEAGFVVLSKLRKFYDMIQGPKPDQLIAWFPPTEDLYAGQAYPPLGGPLFVSFMQDGNELYRDPLFAPVVMAHEIGHNLLIDHPGTGSPACDAGTQSEPNYWPYAADGSGGLRATIHGVGFDWETRTLVPDSRRDVMTYCAPPGSEMWISPFHYKRLFDTNWRTPAYPSPFGDFDEFMLTDADFDGTLFISGWAQRDGSAGHLDPAYHLNGYSPDPTPAPRLSLALPANELGDFASTPVLAQIDGNHCLQFSGARGALGQYCFNLAFEEHRTGQPISEQAFTLKVPFPAGTTKVVLVRDNVELAALTATSSAPNVKVTSVRAGDTWQGTQLLGWSASDPDGKNLTYAALYSPDGGVTWQPLDLDFQEPQLSVDTTDLPSGDQIFFRVVASDGLNTSVADVGPIKIPEQRGSFHPAPAPSASGSPKATPFDGRILFAIVACGGAALLALAYGVIVLRWRRR